MAAKGGGNETAPRQGISKNEAVRRALADLGPDAKLSDLQRHIQERFGLEMSTNHIASSRSDARKQKAGESKPSARTDEPTPASAEANGAAGQAPQGKVNQMAAMRRALAELGNDAAVPRLQAFLKDNLGTEMSAKRIASYRGKILRKAAKKPAAPTSEANKEVMATRSPAEQNRVAATPAPAPTAAVHGTGGIGLDDILTAKALVERVGAEQLRSLIEVLAR
jgi:hypothetical protein